MLILLHYYCWNVLQISIMSNNHCLTQPTAVPLFLFGLSGNQQFFSTYKRGFPKWKWQTFANLSNSINFTKSRCLNPNFHCDPYLQPNICSCMSLHQSYLFLYSITTMHYYNSFWTMERDIDRLAGRQTLNQTNRQA